MQHGIHISDPDDPDADNLPKKRSLNKMAKSKTGRFTGRGQKALDARQYTMCIGSIFIVGWGIAVTFLLLNLGLMYKGDTISLTRENYGVKGALALAQTVASKDIVHAIDVWNVVNASIQGLVYTSPTDYTTLDYVISPAFDTMPSFHSLDLAFSDRQAEVTITRRKEGASFGGSRSFIRSTSDDCFLMGDVGCFGRVESIPGVPHIRPDWYTFGQTLKPSPDGGVFYWAQVPELVLEAAADGGDLLSPSIRLVFQVAFPQHPAGSGPRTIVIGRITLKVDALSGNSLVDKRLGPEGKIYLCDASGAMLASKDTGDILAVENGRVRYKYFWEVGPDWASSVRGAFTGSSVRKIVQETDETLVIVEPLETPLSRFAIIVVVPSAGPFETESLILISTIASIVAPAPYSLVGAMAFVFFWAQCAASLNPKTNSGGDPSQSFQAKRRVSISATINRASRGSLGSQSQLPYAEQEEFTTYTQKMTRLFTMGLDRVKGRRD